MLTPLRRVGVKGSGRYEPVSWDEALAEIAERLHAINAGAGPATILNAHYTGTFALLGYFFGMRFFNRLGAAEVDPDTICNKAGHVALDYVYGTSLDGFDPRTAHDSGCILVWGANPSASAPHQHEHWLPESPATVIVVDPVPPRLPARPISTCSGFQAATPRSRSRSLGTIHREGLCDLGLLSEHVSGSTSSSLGWPVAHQSGASARPGCRPRSIDEAARIYAAGPVALWIGQGFQRQPRGQRRPRRGDAPAADRQPRQKPSTGLLYLNGTGTRGIERTT